jgi:peptidoglycan hydrolase CwlO-like protein
MLEDARRSHESELSRLSFERTTLDTLTTTNRELRGELQRYQELTNSIREVAADALHRIECDAQIASEKGFSDVVTLLAAEAMRMATALRESEAIRSQWEATYVQAREVNSTINAQLREAKKGLSDAREEIAVKDATISKISQELKAERHRWQDTQTSISSTQSETQRLHDQLREAQLRLAQRDSDTNALEEANRRLTQEVEQLRLAIQEREEDLRVAIINAENLQGVLEAYQDSKSREVEERTQYLHHELEQLRACIHQNEAARELHQDELNLMAQSHRKEIASKNVIISGLQGKLAEMRRVLEETMAQLTDEHMIDKRVVSQLVLNYIQAVASDRGDQEDIVKVMSGLLDWDEPMQQRAGLIQGPMNPQRKPRHSLRGLVSGMWSGKSARSTEAKNEGVNHPKSLAALWVDFLLKEADSSSVASNASTSQESLN